MGIYKNAVYKLKTDYGYEVTQAYNNLVEKHNANLSVHEKINQETLSAQEQSLREELLDKNHRKLMECKESHDIFLSENGKYITEFSPKINHLTAAHLFTILGVILLFFLLVIILGSGSDSEMTIFLFIVILIIMTVITFKFVFPRIAESLLQKYQGFYIYKRDSFNQFQPFFNGIYQNLDELYLASLSPEMRQLELIRREQAQQHAERMAAQNAQLRAIEYQRVEQRELINKLTQEGVKIKRDD